MLKFKESFYLRFHGHNERIELSPQNFTSKSILESENEK